MGLAKRLNFLFDRAVRDRGERYAADGSVSLMSREGMWAAFEVQGSHGDLYDVFIDWAEGNLPEMECSCPHFEDGNYCKHLWASLVTVDSLGATEGKHGSADTNSEGKPTKPSAAWQQSLKQAGFLSSGNGQRVAEWGQQSPREYQFQLDVSSPGHSPVVNVWYRELRKNRQWGKPQPFTVSSGSLARVDDPQLRQVMAFLLGNRTRSYRYSYAGTQGLDDGNSTTSFEISNDLAPTIVPMLAATGRFVYTSGNTYGWADGRPLEWSSDTPWQFQLRAERTTGSDGWNISGEVVQDDVRRPLLDLVRWYPAGLLVFEGQLARFTPPADPRWLTTLIAQPQLTVPQEDRDALIRELWTTGQPVKVVGDDSLNLRGEMGSPQGRLVIHPPQPNRDRRAIARALYASVSFLYEGQEILLNSGVGSWFHADSAQVGLRNPEAEAKLVDRLFELRVKPKETSYYVDTPPGHIQFLPADFDAIVAALVADGWEVEAEGRRVRTGTGISLSVRSGVDWFDLEGEVDFDGASASLPELLAALRNGQRTIRLGDGSRGLLPEQWLKHYAPLADLGSKQEGDALRFSRGQALLLDAMLVANDQASRIKVDQRFAALRKQLQSFSGVKPAKPPQGFQGKLREYQQEGLGWLRFLEKFEFGGCLADDMGLGKTVQVLALLAARKRRLPKKADPRPSLVVAPNSVIYNWRQEAERFAPKLKVAEYTGLGRKKLVDDFGHYDLILTTYGTLRKDFERLCATPWDYAILDEAQAIKNASSQTAKASRLLDARHRVALSGTPVENHLGELWSLFEFLNPGLLGSREAFKNLMRSGAEIEASQLETLRMGLAPFMLRRTKAQVLPQLPEKTEQRLYCDLPAAQQKQYNQLREHYRQSLTSRIAESGLAQSKIHVLEALLRLRQAACHPGLVNPKQKEKPSAKLDLLLEQLTEVGQEGHKALVFSQFTALLRLVCTRLEKEGIVYEYLDGKTRNRQARVERFQSDPRCSVFLISLKAGGSGLNLTAADFVYLLDPWWNPAVEAQAIDRTHRIGQTRPVFAYRLIARNTVEEKILELQAQKSSLAEAVISADSSLIKSLTAEDLQAILS